MNKLLEKWRIEQNRIVKVGHNVVDLKEIKKPGDFISFCSMLGLEYLGGPKEVKNFLNERTEFQIR